MGLSKEDDSDAEDEYEFQCFPGSIENAPSAKQECCDLSNCPAYN